MLAISGFVLMLSTSSARTQCTSALLASCQGQSSEYDIVMYVTVISIHTGNSLGLEYITSTFIIAR